MGGGCGRSSFVGFGIGGLRLRIGVGSPIVDRYLLHLCMLRTIMLTMLG